MGIVEAIAGLGYLLQKVFLFIAEGDESSRARQFRIAGWISYLIGLPMWMVIFVIENNFILAFIEGGGVPSMVLGLIIALRGRGEAPTWLDKLAVVMAFVGIIVSTYHFGGLAEITQALELGVAVGFLGGTYFLAKKNLNGWLWYMLMNSSAGTLMWVQGYPVLTIQQAFSLAIVIMAYIKAKKVKR
jgi:EamA domain-containing membrane protein RarD